MVPGKHALQMLLEQAGIHLEPGQVERLWAYHRLLRAANAELNLTRIHNFENMVLKHYVDSLIILRWTELPSPLIDMGSGPGLPGIPLKIARPDVQMILAEPRSARVRFLEEVIQKLGLEGIEVHAGKISGKFTRPVRGVITRAVASIPETLERVARCILPGGLMIFMKGPESDTEIAEAQRNHSRTFRMIQDHAYTLPNSSHHRRLIVYQRLESDHTVNDVPKGVAMREIQSAANPWFKQALELLTGRGIRKHGLALLAGKKIVEEVLRDYSKYVLAWVSDSHATAAHPSLPQSCEWLRLSDPLFRQLDVSGTHGPLLLVRVPEIGTWNDQTNWPDGCTLFVPLQDPENVGAVLRSAAAFGVARVVLLREAAHPFHPKSARAAGPALFQTRLEWGPALEELTISGATWFALAAQGCDLAQVHWPERFGLVVGIEGTGLPDALASPTRVRIPIHNQVESLNAATATAIALYAWRQALPIQPDSCSDRAVSRAGQSGQPPRR